MHSPRNKSRMLHPRRTLWLTLKSTTCTKVQRMLRFACTFLFDRQQAILANMMKQTTDDGENETISRLSITSHTSTTQEDDKDDQEDLSCSGLSRSSYVSQEEMKWQISWRTFSKQQSRAHTTPGGPILEQNI